MPLRSYRNLLPPTYELWICDPLGRRLTDLPTAGGPTNVEWTADISYVKVVNRTGKFTIDYPFKLARRYVNRDNQIQLWRSPYGQQSVKRLDFFGFIRYFAWERDQNGQTRTILKGHDANGLLERRIVAYRDGTDQAKSASLETDDAMKDIINENYDAGATDTDRDLSAVAGLSFNVAGDLTAGPQLDQSYAWRRVSDVLEEMNEISYTGGTEIFYNVDVAIENIQTGKVNYRFRTFTGQIGTDRTDKTAPGRFSIFSTYNGNLANEYYEESAQNERNYIYVLGLEEGQNRDLEEVTDATRVNASVFNRMEGFVDASDVDPDNETAEMQDRGNAELARRRPKILAGGDILSTMDNRYGLDWFHGDKVTIDVFDTQFDGVIRLTKFDLKGGKETVTGRVIHSAT